MPLISPATAAEDDDEEAFALMPIVRSMTGFIERHFAQTITADIRRGPLLRYHFSRFPFYDARFLPPDDDFSCAARLFAYFCYDAISPRRSAILSPRSKCRIRAWPCLMMRARAT